MKIVLISLFISFNLYADYAGSFASSASSMGSNSYTNFDPQDASNITSNPSILAFSDKSSYLFSITHTAFNFDKINNIIVSNEVNSTSGQTSGNVNPNPNDFINITLGLSLKPFKNKYSTLNLLINTPIDNLAIVETNDPYLPHYPLYEGLEKLSVYMNYAQKIDRHAFSLGFVGGIQSKGQAYMFSDMTGSGTPTSNGQISQSVNPSATLSASYTYKINHDFFYMSFLDEQSTRIENDLDAYLSAGGGTIPINWKISALMFYSPRKLQFGMTHSFENFKLHGHIEYQDWSGYKEAILKLESKGGLLASSNNEVNYHVHNIVIPSIGTSFILKNHFIHTSIKYKKSPLELDDKKSKNIIDLDAIIYGISIKRPLYIYGQKFNLSLGSQIHFLQEQAINKSGLKENGTTGKKIGSGGYTGSGEIFATSFAINWIY
ncbi:MAG: hypothetical protein N4A33_04165 [Bacteriovoracaceae bacterium]|jgi:hypothetical protein|nr:hypothetical protein [Bacteriovoracaceae bacterium]